MLNSPTPSSDLYLDMRQFADLKLKARQNSPQAAKAVAQQFEGLFLQMMLKNMRSAAVVDESQHSSTMDFYHEMYDKQLSLEMAKNGGIGLAGLLRKQLGGEENMRQDSAPGSGMKLPVYRVSGASVASELPIAKMDYQAGNPEVRTHPLREAGRVSSADSEAGLTTEAVTPFSGWSDANEFVRDLWPHAERAAAKLGVSPQVLVAQSALETGWGQHSMKTPQGHIAFSLFGIKAGEGWAGRSVSHNTLEFRAGAMQRESARFRAYDSVAEALDDYVDFVQGRGRYHGALQHGGSDEHYIRGLHRAGYATDPAYADKVLSIMKGDTFAEALAALSSSSEAVS